ncbi:hypothetical protein Poli38472_006120 [Pythium oligandrum]|uniref:AAA+ ATPase domain-containing protein n=1 Tax=Pythium oligandrum TaxID=41045 RepID=A0A8K1CTS6_PYTOL|nr:hypothetical protein Poli38472_006120 [Pythium oligandrum]|eukprot:TMW68652.1 hypothetical protein Poli38472_006120 [Pythium oligandrum]
MRATVRSWRLVRAAPKQSTRAAASVLNGAASASHNGPTSAVEVMLKTNATGAVATQAVETMHSSSSSMSFAVASAIAAAAVAVSGQDAQAEEAPKEDEKRLEYSEVVEILREQVSEFRTTLKSTESRIPKAYPIQKIAISRAHAPNGVSTIRIEFVCPPFVDQEAILGRFLLKLQEKTSSQRQPVEVVGVQSGDVDSKSIVESYDLPSVSYLYADGHGSFQFVRDASMQRNKGAKFVFYKDEYLTPGEVDAVVEAYKELYSYPNVHAFFNHEHNQMRRRMLEDRGRKGPNLTVPSPSKDEAIQQLQRLGIDVFEPADSESGLNWDSLAGYDDVKLEIEDTIVLALQNPELYDRIARKTRCRYESNRPRAVLFEGPPGTGKTLSARIIAQQAGIPMIHIPIESVVSKWYGDSEKKMSAIFDACEKFDGAIIFIDEIDALAGDRAHGSMHEASRRILSVLLQKVEGFASAKKTTVICATNRKQDLDSALISRFDLCIRYELPNESTRHAVFARYAKQLNSNELAQLASVASGLSCRDIKEICEYAERKWASKVLKKEVTDDLPPLQAYIDATKVHIVGISNEGSQNDVYA